LFSESQTRFLLEVPIKHVQEFEELMQLKKVIYAPIGETKNKKQFIVYGKNGEYIVSANLKELHSAWRWRIK
ncbi:MAG: hypothetical protein ACE5KT_12085, partial [Methanosarcinales archaeon]